MKTIALIPGITKEVNSKFPDGTIIDETDTNDGTPVSRLIYGEILTNLYKLLRMANVEANGIEDSEDTQFQLVEALQKLPNLLNDIEQVLSLTGTVWDVPFDFTILPNKYVFLARAAEAYVSGPSYTIKGAAATPAYNFTSPTGFNATDEIMVVLDTAGVRAYSLSMLTADAQELVLGLGLPVGFNSTNKLFYQESGNLLSDVPSVDYLESIIRTNSGQGTMLVNDIMISQGFVLCFCYLPSTSTYLFYQFNLLDMSISEPVDVNGVAFDDGTDHLPYVYMDDDKQLYVTNQSNASASDKNIVIYQYQPEEASLEFVSTLTLANDFVKTTNAAVKNNLLYTFVNGVLRSFNLTSGTKVELGTFDGVIGNLFNFQGQIYFCTGEVAKKWF